MPTENQKDKVKNFFKKNKIVRLENRSGDGRNWDVSYESPTEIEDNLLDELISLLSNN